MDYKITWGVYKNNDEGYQMNTHPQDQNEILPDEKSQSKSNSAN